MGNAAGYKVQKENAVAIGNVKAAEIYKLNRIYQDCITRFEKGENVDIDRKRFFEFITEYHWLGQRND